MATLVSHLYPPILPWWNLSYLLHQALLTSCSTSFSHPKSCHQLTVVELGWFGQPKAWVFQVVNSLIETLFCQSHIVIGSRLVCSHHNLLLAFLIPMLHCKLIAIN